MRWRKRKLPANGETRIVRRFAVMPKTLDDGWVVWLESYWSQQEYVSERSGDIWFTEWVEMWVEMHTAK